MKKEMKINGRYKVTSSKLSSQRVIVMFALLSCVVLGVSGLAGTATTTTLSSSLNPSIYGQDVTFTATVSPIPDGGTVTFKDGSTAIGSAAVNTTTGKASLTTNTLSVGTHPITAAYSGTANYDASTSGTVNQVVKRGSKVTVFCSDTPLVVNDTATGTVTISGLPDDGPAPPTGVVHLSHTGNGTLSLTSYTLQESDGGQFEFTYIPTDGDNSPHVITATYAGDSNYAGGSDTFDQAIVKRNVDIQMSLTPTSAYVLQPVTITIHVADDTTAGTATIPTGTVSFDDGGKNGTFSDDTPTIDGSGDCTVTYTPAAGDAGTTTITATYTGSSVHASRSTTGHITVQLRPTQTTVKFDTSEGILVNESTGFTVTVKDIAGDGAVPPAGTISITKSLAPTSEGVVGLTGATASGDHTEWTYSYVRTGLDAEGVDYDVVTANYNPTDGIHTGSEGSYGKAISRRPTEMTLTGCTATANGFQITAEVQEDSNNAGTPSTPAGDFVTEEDSDNDQVLEETVVGTAPGPALISKDTDLPIWNFTVKYKPNDRVHMTSVASETCQKDITPPPGDGTTGANCTDGCGSGGTNIKQMVYNMNAAALALHATQMGLDAAATIASLFPDPVWTAGIVFESGTEIPAKDIVIAALNGTSLALEIAIVTMQTDLDADGIPDVVEENVTNTDPAKKDSDGDAMGDYDEIIYAGGYYGGSRRPNPNNPDSDGDGLLDGYELAPYGTDVCVADSDCDTVPDGEEIACRLNPTEANGFEVTNFNALGYSFTFPFSDPRDWPNPREGDTDGDGLRDDTELGPGRLATNASDTNYSPYVNDADSDGDGIPDGDESTNGDAVWDGTLGGTGNGAASTGHGETHLCLADTDGDGLSDGEEVALFGSGNVHVITPYGTDTNPALDTDSDDDGLSDYEEVNVTHTDPLNYDTDSDGIWDVNEFIATGGAWPHRSFQQISDPLDPDTDDDGLPDNIEYDGTGLGIGHGLGGSDDTVCPYVNDDDSDDDGLQDGHEDANHDGTITNTIGDTGSAGTGETSFCNPDTDGDGLSDGQEEGLFGQGTVTAHTASGDVITVPALDKDSDDDGLSDYEEVNVTHTDPLDYDTDGDSLSDLNELIATGGTYPQRSFQQVSDPLDPDTDDDGLTDNIEYDGTGLGTSHGTGGSEDTVCPYVNDDDSDDDGLQDGVEDANHDGTWGVNGSGCTIGSFTTQAAPASDGYYETDLCNPDTDGDGILDGEEVSQLGGGPILGRPTTWPDVQPSPGFNTVAYEAVSTVLPMGTSPVPSGYTHDPSPSPGTGNELIAPYTFTPVAGTSAVATVPALDVDSDDDGLSDYEEVNITGTDPLDQDSDNDTLMDSDELIATGGTTGATPRRTFDMESNPLDINTDDDHLFDPQEYSGSGLSQLSGATGGARDIACPYVNNDDSDNDGVQDGAVVLISPGGVIRADGSAFSYTHYEDFIDLDVADAAYPGVMRTVPTSGYGEQQDDALWDVCDPDSDGDGLNDGEEIALGTDPNDWDTDDDGRNDWHEVTGGGPISTDPFDPDTDDDGLLDSAEVFGSNNTNPTNADTDGDGLCDGGTGTPWMTSGDARVVVNPICKSCSTPGLSDCGTAGVRTGSADGIGDHPNPHGYGEDKNGNGAWDGTIGQLWQSGASGTPETDPNQYDTDGDADGDGVEVLGFSTSRQSWIPTTDIFGRAITVTYPACGCLEPLVADTDGDQLDDGYEDRNHDGNFDFLPSEFDHQDPLPGPPIPYPTETNPCDPDTDHDDLTDYEERYQAQVFEFYANWDNDGDGLYNEDPVDGIDNDGDGLVDEDPVEPPFNPTNPLDHDTDNDRLYDGYEVKYECVAVTYSQLDNDGDALIDEDPVDGLDNDGDGLIDEDGPDFFVRFVPMLDPTNRDSDSDGFIDGLDSDPCNSELIPVLQPVEIQPIDTDGDGFADDDEIVAGTHPNDPEDYPTAYCMIDLDFDQEIDDRLWLEPTLCCGIANSVVIDIDSNVLIDARVRIIAPRDVKKGDFDGDGSEDDYRYVVEYAFGNYRVVQPRVILTIDDYDGDLTIDHAEVVRK